MPFGLDSDGSDGQGGAPIALTANQWRPLKKRDGVARLAGAGRS